MATFFTHFENYIYDITYKKISEESDSNNEHDEDQKPKSKLTKKDTHSKLSKPSNNESLEEIYIAKPVDIKQKKYIFK